MTATLTSYLNFLRAGLWKHGQTGGIVPSQRFLIAKMIAPVPPDYCGQIIELGAGTGALTCQVATRCPRARILACEINPTLARELEAGVARKGICNRVEIVSAPADQLLARMGQGGMAPPDFIISGIPLGNLGREKAVRLLDAVHHALEEGGTYIQFQHSLLDRKTIRARFPHTRTVTAFLNFPPAVVYYAQKRRG